MLAKSTLHAHVASGNRQRRPMDHDEVARRHLAQAQLHIDIACESLKAALPTADTTGERIQALVAITDLYRALNRATGGKKRGRR